MDIIKFNIRVYGVMINVRNEVLVSDEIQHGKRFTKFPGGGLEFGEGIKDCLKREFLEELNQPIEVLDVVYITDYFQISAFDKRHQLISIYYKVKAIQPLQFSTSKNIFDFIEEKEEAQSLRWLDINSSLEDDMTFPVDKIVLKQIKTASSF
jgi:8-oxo-dGTP diphosphatase